MSGLSAVTPAPSTELPTIYRSGDLVLQNPQETCIIFVSVILISALLEFALQRIGNVSNKYARTLVNTMSQEVTIIGVLALFLMFSVSVIPRRLITPLYVSLFSWANMSLFFMATLFVLTVISQFLWAAVDARLWKSFEEGRMDSEELGALGYRERIYKQLQDLYRIRLERRTGIPATSLPFYEYTSTTLRRQLVRVSNLSYRTWLSLSVVVLANLLRTMLTPFKKRTEEHIFYNALMFVFVIGWGTFLVYAAFVALQQRRLLKYAAGELVPDEGDATRLLPFGTPKRGLEFLQVVVMTFNWYVTLFITGNAKQIRDMDSAWRLSVAYALFAAPVLVFWVTLPWVFLSGAMLTTIGAMKKREAERLSKVHKGEANDSESDDDSDDDDGGGVPPPKGRKKASETGSGKNGRVRSHSQASGSTTTAAMARPAWLEEDDDWDGMRTLVPGSRPARAVEMDRAFYSHVNTDRVRRMLSRHGDPAVSQIVRAPDDDAGPGVVDDDDDGPSVPRGKPVWWEPGDDDQPTTASGRTRADSTRPQPPNRR